MNLILVERDELDATDRGASLVRLARAPRDTRAAHLLDVLTVTPGQQVRVGIVDGPLGTGIVTAITDTDVALRCEFEGQPPARPRVDLLLALPRPKVLRRLWAQLAALGVDRIILTNAARVERNYFDTHLLTPETYGVLLREGLQQARDTRVPRISIHRQFRKLIEDELDGLSPTTTRVVANPDGTRGMRDVVRATGAERVLLAIGPEGGWNAFELSLLEMRGFQRVSMGARTLRSDTACVALLALVHDALTVRPT